jgi:beta-N-acetylhexosaminidase
VTPAPTPGLTLRQKIGRMLIVGFRGTTLAASSPFLRAIAAGELGGVILFDRDQLTARAGRNITSPQQLAALTASIHAAGATAPTGRVVVAIDQEGGKVARLNPGDGYPASPSEAYLGTRDLATTTAAASTTSTQLVEGGIDLNLAPVVDLDIDPTSAAIGALDRSFSADPEVVVAHATAVIAAHHAARVLCAIKHFPGEGSGAGNTDYGAVDVTKTWTQRELVPFQRLIAASAPDAVMVGHIVNGQFDPQHPAALSKATVTGLLRQRLGWSGAVISDDLQASAVTKQFGADEAIALAIEAGVDVLLFANQQVYDPDLVEHVITTVTRFVESGRISEARLDESVARIQEMLAPRE